MSGRGKRNRRDFHRAFAEMLERRVMLSATIVWENQGSASNDSDNFNHVFGTLAPTARNVVLAVIASYEGMIGDFNYSSPGTEYRLELSMGSSTGFAAVAGVTDFSDDTPSGGSVTVTTGNGSADPNDDNGWFIDPTPADSTEFRGDIVNAFAGKAPAGSAIANKTDFYSVIAAEMAHCMGQFPYQFLNAFPDSNWYDYTHNTGGTDQANPGTLWYFDGPDIKHLLTTSNQNQSDNYPIHTAEPQDYTYQGVTYYGATDIGNATIGKGIRLLVDNVDSLMFKDAYHYSSINPAAQGTMYSVLNTTTHELDVRGGDFTPGQAASSDFIDISVSGSILSVSVNIGNDIPGTGTLPGVGNLPAFVSQYAIGSVTSIVVEAGAGNDTIDVDSLPTNMPTTIDGGEGNDTINIADGDYDATIHSNIHVSGEIGTDQLVVNDAQDDAGNDSYSLDNFNFSKPGSRILNFDGNTEQEYIRCSANNDQINVLGTPSTTSVTVDGGNGNDQFYWGNGDISTLLGAVSIIGNGGSDALTIVDDSSAGDNPYTFSNTALSAPAAALNWSTTTESIILAASPGNNQITLNTTPGSPSITINGNGGNDSVFTDPVSYSAAATNGGISINGGAGTDKLFINDSRSAAYTVAVTSSTIYRTFSPVYSYSQLEGIGWNGGGGNDTYMIGSTIPATPVTLTGGAGNDLFEDGGTVATQEFFNLLGAVTLNGNGGSNILIASDNGSPTHHTYTLTASTIASESSAAITYSNMAFVYVTATQTSTSVININGTNAGTALWVDSNYGDDTINVNATASGTGVGTYVTLEGGTPISVLGVGDTINVNADGVGTAVVHLDASQVLAALNVFTGGTVVLESAGNRAVKTPSFNPTGTGALDLTNNAAIVDYTGSSPLGSWNGSFYTGVTGYVASGRNGGSWNGKGIDTSSASGALKVLGVAEASLVLNISGMQTKLFYGTTADATSVLVKYTYGGDANLDGKINIDDYVRIDQGIVKGATGWSAGDFNYDGKINIDDYVIIDGNISNQGSPFNNAAGADQVVWISPTALTWGNSPPRGRSEDLLDSLDSAV